MLAVGMRPVISSGVSAANWVAAMLRPVTSRAGSWRVKTATAGNALPPAVSSRERNDRYGSDVTFWVFFRRAPPRMPVRP